VERNTVQTTRRPTTRVKYFGSFCCRQLVSLPKVFLPIFLLIGLSFNLPLILRILCEEIRLTSCSASSLTLISSLQYYSLSHLYSSNAKYTSLLVQWKATTHEKRVSFQQQLGYWLRCTPPDQTLPAATLLDTRMVEFILNIMRLDDYRPERTVTRWGGITSAKATRMSAYLGSVALSAKIIGDIAPHLKTVARTQPWPSLVQFFQGFNEAKANPHLRLEEHQ
jgi:hypothetical protein